MKTVFHQHREQIFHELREVIQEESKLTMEHKMYYQLLVIYNSFDQQEKKTIKEKDKRKST